MTRLPLTDENQLLRAASTRGDAQARETLVERFMPMARALAKRYAGSREPMEDLTQVAALGLLKAIDRFDPDHGTSFRAYAVPTILGELRRHFRETGWAMHVSRALQERALDVRRTVDSLTVELGRPPTTREVADALSLEPERVIEARGMARAAEVASLNEVVADGQGGSEVQELVGDDDPAYERAEDRMSIEPALSELGERERLVLALRFFASMTQSQIAERLGVSQMQISRLLQKSLRRVHDTVAEGSSSRAAPRTAPWAARGSARGHRAGRRGGATIHRSGVRRDRARRGT